jgi:alkylation response protein AidB-like acyl-CoA dehydrogenase
MDFAYTPEELAFRDEVRSFLAREWGPPDPVAGRDRTDKERQLEFRKRVAEKGWLTMGWPAAYGGTSFSPMERYILSQEMNRVGAPFPLYIVNVLGPLIIKYGSQEMKDELLPRLKSGAIDFTLGFTEPETGSDLASLRTRAVEHGDGFLVNGQKLYGHPDEGDIMFLAVRTDPEAPIRNGISILLVDVPSEGLTVTKNPTLGGRWVGATYYDDVFVPRTRLLGELNRGWDYVRESLDLDRAAGIPYSHFAVLYDGLVDFALRTNSNGHALAEEPWVRERLAELAIELEGAQLLQDLTASKIAAGLKLRTESSIVKTYCTELEGRMASFGMEMFGPLAPFTKEAGVDEFIGAVNFLYRLNVAMTIVGGTNEIQRNILALQGLGLPRE